MACGEAIVCVRRPFGYRLLPFPRIWRANATAPPSETVRARISTDLRLVKFTTSTVLRSTANSYAPVPAHGPPNNTAPAYSSPSINV